MANPIGNPKGAAVSSGTLDQTSTGMRTERHRLLDGTVVAGDALAWTTQTTDDAPTCHAADTSNDDPAVFAGVALQGGISGDVIMAVVEGPALVNIGTETVALAERAIFTTNAGAADGVAADATTVAGDSWGVFLGAEIGTTNQAVVVID